MKIKRYKIKLEKEIKGKEAEVFISKEQVCLLYGEIMQNNDVNGFVVYLEKEKC